MKYRNAQSKKQKTVPQLAGEYERARLERDELTVQFQRMTEKEKLGPEGKANMRKNNRAQQDFRGPGRAPRRDRKRSGSLDDSAAPRVPAAGGGGPSPSSWWGSRIQKRERGFAGPRPRTPRPASSSVHRTGPCARRSA